MHPDGPSSWVRPPLSTALLLLLVPVVAASPAEVIAQEPPGPPAGTEAIVLGTLTDETSGNLISAATVELLSAGDSIVHDRAATDSTGSFRLVAPAPGSYLVRAFSIALDTLVHGPVELLEGEPLELSLVGSANPVDLEGLDVQAVAESSYLREVGFYDRGRATGAILLGPEELERRVFLNMPDLLDQIPGLFRFEDVYCRGVPSSFSNPMPTCYFRVGTTGRCPVGWTLEQDERGALWCLRDLDPIVGESPIYVTRSAPGQFSTPCLPDIYVDGFPMQRGGEYTSGLPYDLRSVMAMDLLAIEVYRSAGEAPAQYSASSAGCGVILAWTKAGLGTQVIQQSVQTWVMPENLAWIGVGAGFGLAGGDVGLVYRFEATGVLGGWAVSGRYSHSEGSTASLDESRPGPSEFYRDVALLAGPRWGAPGGGVAILRAGPSVMSGQKIIHNPCFENGCVTEWEELEGVWGLALEAGVFAPGRFMGFSVVAQLSLNGAQSTVGFTAGLLGGMLR